MTKAVIGNSVWHDFDALTLENDLLSITIVPRLGAKIVSLLDKKLNREWLASPIRQVAQTQYGQSFVDQDMSGWDEMFPTIVACEWEGRSFPDHGEVWSCEWTAIAKDDELAASVKGIGLDYELSRSISFAGMNRLQLNYRLWNRESFSFPWLWAAHPQFLANERTRILLPEHINRVMNVVSNDPVFGDAALFYGWPVAELSSGGKFQLDRVRNPEVCACRKFYSLPEDVVSWAVLRDEQNNSQMKLSWKALFPLYFGVWVDEGFYNTATVIAPEPTSGFYDGLPMALKNNRVSWINPDEKITWTLEIEISENKK